MTVIRVPTGCYELKAINAEIIRIRGNSDIAILPNINMLQCILTVVGAKCKVSFDVSNSLASVLGFKQDIVYGVGRYSHHGYNNCSLFDCDIPSVPPPPPPPPLPKLF